MPYPLNRISRQRPFLRFLWNVMSNEEIGLKVHFVIAMNQPHYASAYNISEIMGKFELARFKPLQKTEMIGILNARLSPFGMSVEQVFDDESLDLILEYTCGVTRNILTLCGKLFDAVGEGQKVTREVVIPILDDAYAGAVIEDRTRDLSLVPIYKDIINTLDRLPEHTIESKEKLARQVAEITGNVKSQATEYINDLIKWGLISEVRGGYKRSNRILSLTFKNGTKGNI